MNKLTIERKILIAILIAAGVMRLGMLLWKSAHLHTDPDAYVALANELDLGRGLVKPGSDVPTAFRPPLYPVLLASLLCIGSAFGTHSVPLLIGVFHLILGTATIWLTYRFCLMWRMPTWATLLSAILVAVDPLLLWYTTYPMTETVFTFLVIALLYASRLQRDMLKQIAIGLLFGLCALCRPSIWPFGALMILSWIRWLLSQQNRENRHNKIVSLCKKVPWMTLLIAVGTLVPWGIRNQLIFGKPILTTTHGGYTLLLGNNPVFYKEVVSREWGTTWKRESLTAWQQSLETDIQLDLGKDATEPARDRWMYGRAIQNISNNLEMFSQACLLRFVRFWNVAPLGETASAIPGTIYWAVFGYYLLITLGLIPGLYFSRKHRTLEICAILIISFTLVHMFFWSNTRMRAPLIPAISILSVYGWYSLFKLAGLSPTRKSPDTQNAARP